MRVAVLKCILVILVGRCAVACQPGEKVDARWIDGSWKAATIVEVQDGPDGTCGQYRLSWHHTRMCEDSTNEYWGDRPSDQAFCFVSRDAIDTCKEELCKRGISVAAKRQTSKSPEKSHSSGEYLGGITMTVLGLLGGIGCCICARICFQMSCPQVGEVDEEKAMDAVTPSSRGGTLWTFSPSAKSDSFWARRSPTISSSPMARWINKTRTPTLPSNVNTKIVVQPNPVAVKLANNHSQPERWTGTTSPEHLSGNAEAFDKALRQAAQVFVAPSRVYAPSPQQWRQPQVQQPAKKSPAENQTKGRESGSKGIPLPPGSKKIMLSVFDHLY